MGSADSTPALRGAQRAGSRPPRSYNPAKFSDRLVRLIREKAVGTREDERHGHSRSLLELEALVGAGVEARAHSVKLLRTRARDDSRLEQPSITHARNATVNVELCGVNFEDVVDVEEQWLVQVH
jgi:hypothetical protein